MGAHLKIDHLPSNLDLALYSDVHIGSRLHHDDGFKRFIQWLRTGKHRYAFCLGDLVHGQPLDHPHAHPETQTTFDIGDQYDQFIQTISPAAEKHLGILRGNHDWRHDTRSTNFVRNRVCPALNVPYLGSRAYIQIGPTNIFLAHVGLRLPKGAKDLRQRRANREAALQRNLEEKWSSAHLEAYGDTHQLIVAGPPEERLALMLTKEGEIKQRRIPWPELELHLKDGSLWVDPGARWYANTGTFQRGGAITAIEPGTLGRDVFDDFADNRNLDPTPTGYVVARIRKDRIHNVREVFA